MNARLFRPLLVLFAAMVFQGCVAIPPLVHVEKKENTESLSAIQHRLDSIDRRLDRLEQQKVMASQPGH